MTSASSAHTTYDSFTLFCLTLNISLGVGILGLPAAFSKSGYAFGIIALFIASLMAYATCIWIVEIGRRANALVGSGELPGSGNGSLEGSEREGFLSSGDPDSSDLLTEAPAAADSANQLLPGRKFEINELMGIILGPKYKRAYEILFLCYTVGMLWTYAAVFASSVATRLPLGDAINGGNTCDVTKDSSSECNSLYLLWLLIFSLITVPLSCLDLSETKLVQIALSMFRFLAIGTMLSTSIHAIWSYPNEKLYENKPLPTSAPYYSDITAFDPSGLGVMLPIAITALVFHHAIPGLIQPARDQKALPRVFAYDMIVIFILYSAMGLVVGLYYGSSTEAIATLNWADYSGHSEASRATPFALFIRYMVVLFPPIDIASAYPLNANVLGNTLMAAFITDAKKQKSRTIKVFFRIVASVPPIAGAMVLHDLGKILQFMGLIGVIVVFIVPSVLQYYSLKLMEKRLNDREVVLNAKSRPILPSGTTLDRIINSNTTCFIVFSVCTVILIACWILFFMEL